MDTDHTEENQPNGQCDDLKPRNYQDQILEEAIKKNTIIYLPTGAGKTFIALMAMKRLAKDLDKPLSEGGKRSVFVVNTVALALQQQECIKRRTAFKTAVYTGDLNVDLWSHDRWSHEFEENQVLVATCQIILDVIRHGYIKMKQLNVIVFDEAHHATKDTPMHQLLGQYAEANETERPRIIGLTGMLISGKIKPGNVRDYLLKLETTFSGTITTVRSFSDHANVLIYSTNPDEQILRYESESESNLQQRLRNIIESVNEKVNQWTVPSGRKDSFKKITCLLSDFIYQMNDLGNFGASMAALTVHVELEMMKRSSETKSTKQIVRQSIVYVEQVRGILLDQVGDIDDMGDILTSSSQKIIYLIKYLQKSLKTTDSTELKALIFVRRRHTAKNLYHILQQCALVDPNFLIRPDFMVGSNSGLPESMTGSIEQVLDNKWNKQVLERFKKNETNLIVATSVLEEGIDLQMCNLVISYDQPMEFRSYIQSKGRARMQGSKYVVLCPYDEYTKFEKKLKEWNEVDNNLKEYLIGKTIDRPEPMEEDVKNEFANLLIPPFRTLKGAVLESQSAIQLLNRYCQSMPNDIFTSQQVIWDSSSATATDGFIVTVTLPIQSVVKDAIKSDPMPSLKMAKRSAAFNACKALYENGELNDNLFPIDVAINFEIINDIYFKHYDDFPQDNGKTAGTKKNKRNHTIIYPEELIQCTPVIGSKCYLHTFIVTPKFNTLTDDYGGEQFFKLLSSENCFGILTTKMLPKLAAMNFFITLGKIGVEIQSPPIDIVLTDPNDLKQLRNFHCTLFSNVLQIHQSFLAHDFRNKENSFLIVPVTEHEINWKCVNDFQNLVSFREFTNVQRREMTFNEDDYKYRVISPFYRSDIKQRYIVTKIHNDKTPYTPFPSQSHVSYADYFNDKYSKTIVDAEQFLVEVKPVTQSLNFLTPGEHEGGSKKFAVKGPELLVPELCVNYKFPGDLFLKAILLPSILHRMHYLLHAEKLRTNILKYLNIPTDIYQPKPVIEKMQQRPKFESVIDEGMASKSIIFPDPNQTPARLLPNKEIATLKDKLEYQWPEVFEPLNLNRYIADLYPIEIDYYMSFTRRKLKDRPIITKSNSFPDSLTKYSVDNLAICDAVNENAVDEIKLLNLLVDTPTFGPEQCDILAALTSTSAGDVFDMERLELIGDSFLKFATSFFLLQKHPTWHEGFLTSCKGRLVSNRNLCYLAIGAELPGLINNNKFNPKSDWTPPLYCLPENIKIYTREINDIIVPNMIHKLKLSTDEIRSGIVSDRTLHDYVAEFLNEQDNPNIDSTMLHFFGEQRLSDKTIADCVESIIGTCVVSLGIERSLPILKMLQILPSDNDRDYQFMLREPFVSPRLRTDVTDSQINNFLPNCENIEEALGYRFKDRAYLLQALTHPSFQNNRYTQCYQQSEFLGDAILDFLISAYIYERCPDKNPGQLTDLRSALVNNITLACICVRNNFHLHILSQSSVLLEKIMLFCQYQEKEKHAVTEQVLLLTDESDNTTLGDFVDVPKILGDVVEAIFGAVFLDSGNNLRQTWTVIYKLMKEEIDAFMKNVPIQVVRRLYEFTGANAKFEDAVVDGETVMIAVRFTCKNEVLRVEGFGPNSAAAKRAAAKVALHKLTMN